jgi:wobble nucleotide-excising tRNase
MHQMRISTAEAEKVGNPKKKCENCERANKNQKQTAMILSQTLRRIELCMWEIYSFVFR